MDDKLWQELLASPYDEQPKPDRKQGRGYVGVMIGTALAVVVGGTVGWLLAPESTEASAASTTTTMATTTTEPTVPSEPGFLPGFTALGDTAFAPVFQFTSGDRTYLAISEIVGSGSERTETEPTPIAEYGFPDGLTAVREVTAVAAPGIRLVEFEGPLGDAPLPVTRGTDPVVEATCPECGWLIQGDAAIELPFESFPVEIEGGSIVIDVGQGRSIIVDRLVLEDEWGIADWHVESDDGLVAQVEIFVNFVGTEMTQSDGSISTPAALIPSHFAGPRFGQSQPPARPGMAQAGTEQLARTGPHITSENQPTGIAIGWSVTWSVPTDDSATLEPASVVLSGGQP